MEGAAGQSRRGCCQLTGKSEDRGHQGGVAGLAATAPCSSGCNYCGDPSSSGEACLPGKKSGKGKGKRMAWAGSFVLSFSLSLLQGVILGGVLGEEGSSRICFPGVLFQGCGLH